MKQKKQNNIYGLTKVRSSVINISKSYWTNMTRQYTKEKMKEKESVVDRKIEFKKKNDIRIIKTVDMGIRLQLSALMINKANQFSI